MLFQLVTGLRDLSSCELRQGKPPNSRIDRLFSCKACQQYEISENVRRMILPDFSSFGGVSNFVEYRGPFLVDFQQGCFYFLSRIVDNTILAQGSYVSRLAILYSEVRLPNPNAFPSDNFIHFPCKNLMEERSGVSVYAGDHLCIGGCLRVQSAVQPVRNSRILIQRSTISCQWSLQMVVTL